MDKTHYLRDEAIEILQLISTTDRQVQYEHEVPIADVPAELVCMWFDDFYHPQSPQHREAFCSEERTRLAEFNKFYSQRVEELPDTLEEMHRCSGWREIQIQAARTLELLRK